MNIYGIIIISVLILELLLKLASNTLNLKALDKELPSEFQDVFNSDEYKKSQEYTKERTKFGLFSSIFGTLVFIIFWLLEGFPLINDISGDLSNNFYLQGLSFFGILLIGQFVLNLPFKIYSTFVIEEKYGFNNTDTKTFVTDILKGLIIGLVLGAPLLYLILFLFNEIGENSWLYAWLITVLVTFIIQYIAPKWIMPIFNKFEPLEDGELKKKILDFADSVNFSLQDVYVMDGSKRSSKSNAFFTGFGKNKRIALFDTLIEKHTEDELVSVLAHEIGHYKKKHIQKSMFISVLHTGVIFFLLSIFLYDKGLYNAFYMNDTPIYAGLLFFSFLYSPIELILSVIMNVFSRKNEFEADEYAVVNRKNKSDMIDALKKLSKDNLSNLTPHSFYVFLNYSHPPVVERIRAIEKMKY